MSTTACCAPGGSNREAQGHDDDYYSHSAAASSQVAAVAPAGDGKEDGRPMRALSGGSFLMGTDDAGFPDDGEGPVREVTVDGFQIDVTAVSNAEFAEFLAASGYVTEAERFGWSFVFIKHVPKSLLKQDQVRTVPGLAWWYAVDRACWLRPEGAGSSVRKRGDHPVVHVSHADATAYAAWAGKRLPTEAEWELAARGGLEQKRYPWGNELHPGGKHRCNIFQGTFPEVDTAADGYAGTCPVRTYRPNGLGLYNMAGNVWEWCADWFSPDHHRSAARDNPAGPDSGVARVMRGGSFLCHRSYCNRYRVAARTSNTPDSSTANLGFRCARDGTS